MKQHIIDYIERLITDYEQRARKTGDINIVYTLRDIRNFVADCDE